MKGDYYSSIFGLYVGMVFGLLVGFTPIEALLSGITLLLILILINSLEAKE